MDLFTDYEALEKQGSIGKIEETWHQIIMENGTVIPMNDIYETESTVFDVDEY